MGFRGCLRILISIFVLSWDCTVTASVAAERCNRWSKLQLLSDYYRSENVSMTGFYFQYDAPFVLLEGDRLTTPYSWIDVSVMEPERQLAVSQKAMLKYVVSKFPKGRKISVDYMISNGSALVKIRVDLMYAFIQAGQSTVDASDGIDAQTASFCATDGNLTEFLRSSSAVMSRWLDVCADTLRRDTINSINVTLLYHSNVPIFRCSTSSAIPVDHEIAFTCVGRDGKKRTDNAISMRIVDGETATWAYGGCNLPTAKCIVYSENGWAKEVGIRYEEENLTVLPHTSNTGTKIAMSLFVVSVALAILAFLWHRYRPAMTHLNDTSGLTQEGRERLHGHGRTTGYPC